MVSSSSAILCCHFVSAFVLKLFTNSGDILLSLLDIKVKLQTNIHRGVG